MIRDEARWNTRFGSFVEGYSVTQLVQELCSRGQQVTPSAVYKWVGGAAIPRPSHSQVLVELSQGQLTMDDVLRHHEELKDERGPVPRRVR